MTAPVEVKRDRWGRPLISQPTGRPKGYTRVSSLAKALDDTFNLDGYKVGTAMLGLAERAHLFQTVCDIHGAIVRDDITDGLAWDAVKELGFRDLLAETAELAREAIGANIKRDLGTELHSWMQQVDEGLPVEDVPAIFRKDVDAYLWATVGIRPLASEVFVVVDEIEAAGTLDNLSQLPDGRVVIADKKTGQNDCRYPMSVEMQVATYARGQRYDLATGVRSPLHPDGVDQAFGLLIHAPSRSGVCDLYPLDLERGWANVQLALEVKAARKRSGRPLQSVELSQLAGLGRAA